MIKNRNHLQNGCKNNKILVQPIGWLVIKSMHEIIERTVLITYLWYIIKDCSLDDQYTVQTISPWKNWTVVRAFMNIQNECKNNKRLFISNDRLKTESVEVIIKILILWLTCWVYDKRHRCELRGDCPYLTKYDDLPFLLENYA